MPFQIKDFASIVASEINHARAVTTKVTDFQPGSVMRTLMEAPAVEIEALYIQMLLGLRDAIPVATFLSFGFSQLQPKSARGFVSVSTSPPPSAPIFVPLGTKFTTSDGRSYSSTATVTWPAGVGVFTIPVAADVPGLNGNVAPGVINASPLFGRPFIVSNSAIDTGRDLESDSEREARFAEFVGSLSRGTVAACKYGASLAAVTDSVGNILEYVTRVGLDETTGSVSIYIYGSGGVPSAALLQSGTNLIEGGPDVPGYRAAGIKVQVLPMSERAIAGSFQVFMLAGYTLTTAAKQALGDIYSSAISAIAPGDTLYLGTLVEDMLAVPGVSSIVPLTDSNITCGVSEALIPGTLTFTQAAA
jgi:hypothetical protein